MAAQTEEPISDFTFHASEQVCNLARARGYNVVLSGMGGDEAFAGYPRYLLVHLLGNRSPLGIALSRTCTLLRRIKRFDKKADRRRSCLEEEDFALAYCRTLGYLSSEELSALVPDYARRKDQFIQKLHHCQGDTAGGSRLKRAMRLDYYGFLAHNLTVADRSSMAVSVDMRVPLLDHTVYAAATALPDGVLIKRGRLKSVLKDLLLKVLDRDLVERPKTGFNPPLDGFINSLGEQTVRDLLLHGPHLAHINREPLARIIEEHFSMGRNNTTKLWQLLYFRCWVERWQQA